ncbi:MAG: 16S rRNA (guanine(527)-N(7))-methyltransferase RsmG [Dehalococcoidia bacterium]|nr:16S rRNA (guanine(527)-N(7))-methyltransferase RsmG [Dehalococcoidia bacterium]
MDALPAVSKRLSIGLSPEQLQAFDIYLSRLLIESPRAGLTSLTDRGAIQRRHFAESLALLRALEDAGVFASPAIDIGTGAGFPGLPIKIARPALELTLLEATGKKAVFLEQIVRELGLQNVTVVHGRAEDLARDPAQRGRYRLALARAVAPLRTLVELALPFLRIGGVLATPKGSAAPREVEEAAQALAACGGTVERVQPLAAAGPGPAPTLVVVRKTAETPERFPRRAGTPSRRPL